MKKIISIAAILLASTSAQAFWGNNGYGYGAGDTAADGAMDFSFSMSGSARGNGAHNGYYNGYNGYPYYYGAPVIAPQPPVAAAPTTEAQ